MKPRVKITLKKKQNTTTTTTTTTTIFTDKRALSSISLNLPFNQDDDEEEERPSTSTQHLQTPNKRQKILHTSDSDLADSFQSQGNKLAEDGRYKEALGKWETALTFKPDRAVLHEQKAQVLLEIGEAWNALRAATRATELEPSWAEAWVTLARTQLNFGEPDAAIESFDRALAIKPEVKEAQADRQTAMHLVRRRKQLQLSGLIASESRYVVGDASRARESMDTEQV